MNTLPCPSRASIRVVLSAGLFVGMSSAANAFAAEYYVATTGSDSNAGTIDKPFATLQKAANTAIAGDTVLIRGGTYKIVSPATSGAGISITKSGTSDKNRIRFWAYPGETPVFDFSKMAISTSGYTSGFVVSGSWLHFKGLEICNVPMNTRSNTGMGVNAPAHDNIFEQLNFHHNNGAGFFISHGTGGHLVLNCDSHDNYDPTSSQGDGQNADGFGAHYQETGAVTTFRGCRAWWNSDDGWDLISQEVPVIIEDSWAMSNGYIKSGTARPADGNGNGFKAGSSKTGIRHIVRNNLAWGNRAAGYYANHSSGGNDWINNTAYNNATQYNLLASTWDSTGNRTDGVTLSGSRAHKMRNNIGFPNKNSYVDGYGVDTAFNTWDLGLTPAASDFAGVDTTGAMGPRQADGSLPNLAFMKLSARSKMIDRGTNVGLHFVGSAPDLGAYEYGASAAVGGATGTGGGGTIGTGGAAAGGTGGSGGHASAGATNGGTTTKTGGAGGVVSASGGVPGSGGFASSGGAATGGGAGVTATIGGSGTVALGGTATTTSTGGTIGNGGSAALGSTMTTATADSGEAPVNATAGGNSASGSDLPTGVDSGCSCLIAPTSAPQSTGALLALLAGLGWVVRGRSKRGKLGNLTSRTNGL